MTDNNLFLYALFLLAALNGNTAELLIVFLVCVLLSPSLAFIGEMLLNCLKKALRRLGLLTD